MNVFITGASVGIGHELAIKFASLGYNLFLTYYTNYENILELKKAIESNYKVKCVVTKLDLHDEKSINMAIEKFKVNFDKLDILVNNSSVSNDDLILNKTKNEFNDVIETNITGNFLITKGLINYLIDGVVVNMSSTDGISTYNEYNIDYAVSKAAIIQLNRSFAYSFKNIKFISIAPNWVDTESTRNIDKIFLNDELKRIGQKKLISINKVVDTIINSINDDKIKSGDCVIIYE